MESIRPRSVTTSHALLRFITIWHEDRTSFVTLYHELRCFDQGLTCFVKLCYACQASSRTLSLSYQTQVVSMAATSISLYHSYIIRDYRRIHTIITCSSDTLCSSTYGNSGSSRAAIVSWSQRCNDFVDLLWINRSIISDISKFSEKFLSGT
jgi:hypothetical protein